ncbi:MAG: winged helix-turn-helix transcriptional regulator [Halobacteriales archaeon]
MDATCTVDDGTPACYCPLSGVIDLLARKYTIQIVCVVGAHDRVRFGEIEDHLSGASTSTLSARLDELEAAGLLAREQYDEIPPRVEYRLTGEGQELAERLDPLLEWVRDRDPGSGGKDAV